MGRGKNVVDIFAGAALAKPDGLAKEMRQANARGESLGLSEDELAFYDALEDQRQRHEGTRRQDGRPARFG